jgi:alcohol dehydrogenase, propanol-preferring
VRAVVLDRAGSGLRAAEVAEPVPARGQRLLEVRACGVCRTDLHLLDGEVRAGRLPLIPGHQIVGVDTRSGERVGVPWVGWTCGECGYCRTGRENLCDRARFTGCDIDGGFAELTVADERFCLPLPDELADEAAAPLLCGGLIGYRALRMAGDAERVGIFGFGSAAHQVAQVARHQGRRVFAFTRPGDGEAQRFARELGVDWSGGTDEVPPAPLDAALIFAPAGELVPLALRLVVKGAPVVCGGIHMSDIPSFPYADLWGERVVRSVANLTRADGVEFLALAAQVPVRTTVATYPLERAGEALEDLRAGRVLGSAVVVP